MNGSEYTKVLFSCGLLVYLVGFIREDDLVEDLSGLVLYCIYLHQMRWVATSTSAEQQEINELAR